MGDRSAVRAGRRIAAAVACGLSLGAALARPVRAQTPRPSVVPPVPAPRDSTATDTAPRIATDTVPRPIRGPRRRPPVAPRSGLLPPIPPGRAFLSSLLLPGLGQSRLQRPTAGAVFVAIEFGVIGMLVKSNADLRSARSFRADSVPSSYPLDSLGNVITRPKPPQQVGGFTEDLIRARRLHREDWIAALAFNHLISGAEAFVSANLYDLPAQITARPSSQGTVVALSIGW